MPRYANGRIPTDALVQFDTGGGRHVGTVGTRQKWYTLRANVKARTGKTLQITSGMNVYRDWAEQGEGRRKACAQGNCNAAASQGYSSHGGTWRSSKYTGGQWVDTLAIDVGNYGIVGQAVFYEEARKAGFLAGAITPELAGIFEPWHIIDLDPYRAVPAGGGGTPISKEWDEMATKEEIRAVFAEELAKVRKNDFFIVSYGSETHRNGIFLAGFGFWHPITAEQHEHFNWLKSNYGHTLFNGLEVFVPSNDRSWDILKDMCLNDGLAEGEGIDYEKIKELTFQTEPPAIDYPQLAQALKDAGVSGATAAEIRDEFAKNPLK